MSNVFLREEAKTEDPPAAGSKSEIAYARLADKTPHIVLSKTLDKVAWKTTRIVWDVEEIRRMKQQPGKDIDCKRMAYGGFKTIVEA